MKQILLILWLAVSTSFRADTLAAPPEFANAESPAEITFLAFRNSRVEQVFNGNYFGPLLEKWGYIAELRFRVDGAGSGMFTVW